MSLTDIPHWFLFGTAVQNRGFLLHCGAGFAEEADLYNMYGFHKVLWIEANPLITDRIQKRLNAFPGQTLCSAALWDENDVELELYSATNFYSSSLLIPKEHLNIFPLISFEKSETVKTKRLDSLNIEIPFSSVLVMDIQGAECKALLGATKILNRFDFIYSEYSLVELYEGGSRLNVLTEILEKEFQIYIKLESKKHGYGNVLFGRIGVGKRRSIRIQWWIISKILLTRFHLGNLRNILRRSFSP